MPKETTNHKLKKPLYSDNADIAVINENFDTVDELLTPSVYASTAPDSSAGQNSWQSNPPVTLAECANHIQSGTHQNASVNANGFMSYSDKQKLNNATSEYTSSRLMMRDSNGRAKVKNPSTDYEIANKKYVDTNFVKKNSDTAMSAKLTAQSNTAYTTKQVRNIVLWTSGSTPPSTSYGDIVIKTF